MRYKPSVAEMHDVSEAAEAEAPTLLELMGPQYAKLLQKRLQQMAEEGGEEPPEQNQVGDVPVAPGASEDWQDAEGTPDELPQKVSTMELFDALGGGGAISPEELRYLKMLRARDIQRGEE